MSGSAAALAELHSLAIVGAENKGIDTGHVSDLMATIMRIDSDDDRLDTAEAAEFINRAKNTLERWRSEGSGPAYETDANGRKTYRRRVLREFRDCGK